MRRRFSSKPNTYTEAMDVDAAGISVKVTRITPGDLRLCLRLLMLRSIRMGSQKSADAVVGWLLPTEGLNIGYGLEPADSMMQLPQQERNAHRSRNAGPVACAGRSGCAVHRGISGKHSERG